MTLARHSIVVRPLLCLLVVLAALITQPRDVPAQGNCNNWCHYGCPGDPHTFCQTLGGPGCGLYATCTSSQTDQCGPVMAYVQCRLL